MRQSIIAARQIEKTYGSGAASVRALASVDLNIRTGEVTLLVGPSGSGKTTLVSILGAILRPSRGRLAIAGEDDLQPGPPTPGNPFAARRESPTS